MLKITDRLFQGPSRSLSEVVSQAKCGKGDHQCAEKSPHDYPFRPRRGEDLARGSSWRSRLPAEVMRTAASESCSAFLMSGRTGDETLPKAFAAKSLG